MYLPSIFGYPTLTQSHLSIRLCCAPHLLSRSSKNASAEISLWSPSSSMQSWQASNASHNFVAANGRFRGFQKSIKVSLFVRDHQTAHLFIW
jgi:hypothetical protein